MLSEFDIVHTHHPGHYATRHLEVGLGLFIGITGILRIGIIAGIRCMTEVGDGGHSELVDIVAHCGKLHCAHLSGHTIVVMTVVVHIVYVVVSRAIRAYSGTQNLECAVIGCRSAVGNGILEFLCILIDDQ